MLSDCDARRLLPFLSAVTEQVDVSKRLQNDPLGIVRGFELPEDRELVALLASSLAYGQVGVMRRAIEDVLRPFGPYPSSVIETMDPTDLLGALEGWLYRMTRATDVVDLLVAIRTCRRDFGSLEAAYLAQPGTHVERMAGWVGELRQRRWRIEGHRGFFYLLPDPALGGATKRLHLFFRWVVRPDDGVDLGLWPGVDPACLLMPIDTHTARLCRYLGLTDRKGNDQKTVEDIAASLRKLDPADPMRFDFALCHLGISGSCIHRRSELHCPFCPINEVCALPFES